MSEEEFRPGVVLITGGAGFVGSNLIRWLLRTDAGLRVLNLDALTYAGNLASLQDVEAEYGREAADRYRFVHGDIRDDGLVAALLSGRGDHTWRPDAVLHLAAESHVDRSITGPETFVSTNVLGTHTLLIATRRELAHESRPFRFINVSTDEVYGSLGPQDRAFTEDSPLRPNSPYAASKAAADCLVRAYAETFGIPCLTTRCSNTYGPYQLAEKLIPLMITRALHDDPLPVYGDGLNVRDWIHVLDHASAIWAVCTRGSLAHHVYNVGSRAERANLDIVRMVLAVLGKPESLISLVRDRPGHDRRYAIDPTRLESTLGWRPQTTFAEGLQRTIEWYVANREWWAVHTRQADLAPGGPE